MNNGIKFSVILIIVAGFAAWLWFSDSPPKPIKQVQAPTSQAPQIAKSAPPQADSPPQHQLSLPDSRLATLQAFLNAHDCLDKDLAAYYIQDADENNLDYRLLPALSFKEESCTKNGSMNNLWGWESGAKKFSSLSAGIDFISDQLAHNHFYSNKTNQQKLEAYGPKGQGYTESVLKIMSLISN